MQIKNLGEDYATITGGFVKTGETTIIEKWELPLIEKLGHKVEIIEEPVEVKKKKK